MGWFRPDPPASDARIDAQSEPPAKECSSRCLILWLDNCRVPQRPAATHRVSGGATRDSKGLLGGVKGLFIIVVDWRPSCRLL